jgi:hypothetical protein
MNRYLNYERSEKADLTQAVFDIIAAEMTQLSRDDLIASMQRNALSAPEIGAMIPATGCRFCLPQPDESESEFTCDLKACVSHSLTYHVLGILQDAALMLNMANVATAHARLATVLQTIFGEQKSEEIAARLMKTLEGTG